jgi:hypothetical protein
MVLGEFYGESVSIAVDADAAMHPNYSEVITIAAESSMYPIDYEFLWNDVADVSTTWTKVEYPN